MTLVLAILDILGAFVMVMLMLRITEKWGYATANERWSTVRRVIYCAVAVALFWKGTQRLEHIDALVDMDDGIPQTIILIALIIFPALRAFGVISQDHWGEKK